MKMNKRIRKARHSEKRKKFVKAIFLLHLSHHFLYTRGSIPNPKKGGVWRARNREREEVFRKLNTLFPVKKNKIKSCRLPCCIYVPSQLYSLYINIYTVLLILKPCLMPVKPLPYVFLLQLLPLLISLRQPSLLIN